MTPPRENSVHRLLIANSATAVPMGAEIYQEEIASRAQEALAACSTRPDEWRVDRMVLRSLRSPLAGTHRLPMGWSSSASAIQRRALGRLLYPRRTVVHRMNLELPPSPYADIVTLHDVVAWKFPDESPPVRAAREELRRAAAVICVSTFTAAEASDLLGIENPLVIPNGVHGRFFDATPLPEAVLRGMGIAGPYVLASGGASERKNLDALAAAWGRIHSSRPDLTLVLSGPEHPRRTRLFRELPKVQMVGRVPADLVPGLMASASVVVVPSRYEGFGLPALEAMAAGTPLVAADTSSLPEVVGDGGILVPPTPDGIAQGVLYAASGNSEVAQAVLRGRRRVDAFTWERSAQAHAAVWAGVNAA